jgi:hypothetical protein
MSTSPGICWGSFVPLLLRPPLSWSAKLRQQRLTALRLDLAPELGRIYDLRSRVVQVNGRYTRSPLAKRTSWRAAHLGAYGRIWRARLACPALVGCGIQFDLNVNAYVNVEPRGSPCIVSPPEWLISFGS